MADVCEQIGHLWSIKNLMNLWIKILVLFFVAGDLFGYEAGEIVEGLDKARAGDAGVVSSELNDAVMLHGGEG